MQLVEIKDFNALIDNKSFLDALVKSKQESYETYWNVKKWWLYNRKFIRLFVFYLLFIITYCIDLSRQTNTNISLKINFTGGLEEDDGATMSFIAEKQQKTILNFSLDSLIVTE